jgi:CheY-like chemotaxis protein
LPPRSTETIEILSVEDNPADVVLIKELFKHSAFRVNVNFLGDGEELFVYLRKQGKYTQATLPNLILLDLNLPRKDGREVLRELKRDPKFRSIPTLILTASTRDEDILNCYENAANCYITKPNELNDFDSVIRGIESFWLSIAQLPQAERALCSS